MRLMQSLIGPSRRLGLAVMVALGLVAVLVAYSSLPLLLAMNIQPGPAPRPVPEAKLEAKKKAFDDLLTKSTEAVVARAPFGKVKVAAKPTPKDDKPLVPSRYGGSSLVGLADNAAWFADGKRIRIGEEQGGVKVLDLDPPWTAKLRWSGGEYTVTLFDRQPISLAQSMNVWLGAPPPPPPPPPETPKPVAPPAAKPAATTPAGSTPPGAVPAAQPAPAQPVAPPAPQPVPVPLPPPEEPDGKN